jgi:GntR family transcriptional regulator / MocR family aminotransferase
VTRAYGQLITEGYLAGRTGSATRVCWSPTSDDGRVVHQVSQDEGAPPRPVRFDLSQCQPDFRAFPRQKWVEAIRTAAEAAQFDQLGYSESGAEPRLRAVLADHLNRRRGAAAQSSTISIFSGAGQSMSQLARALFEAGHTH